jgi:putative membrane protein
MMGWYDNGMGWGGWLLMTLAMVAFWALVVFVVVALFRSDASGAVRRTPEEILNERFARGDIDAAEYHARRDALHGDHPSRPTAGTGRQP